MIPWACVPLRGIEPEPWNVRRVGELGSPGIDGEGREAEETAEPVRTCFPAEVDELPPRGVVTLSNLVESPTVESDEGSWEGR